MRTRKPIAKTLKLFIGLTITVYLGICGFLYVMQEELIFHPTALPKDYQFEFDGDFEEFNIEVEKNIYLNALLFKSDSSSRGLVFYLHGNARAIADLAWVHSFYNQQGYDFLILDYRGYGKSDGENSSEDQIMRDVQTVYDQFLPDYADQEIIIMGYSLGTGIASKLAWGNDPSALVLQAPYYSLEYMALQDYPFVPTFILKYPFLTHRYLSELSIPIYIFHGRKDGLITSDQSEMLLKTNASIQLKLIDDCDHNRIVNHPEYEEGFRKAFQQH